jgi:hypothetical protein
MKCFIIIIILAVTLSGCAINKHEDFVEINPEVSKEAHAYFILYGLNAAFEKDWFMVGRSYRALVAYDRTYGSIEAAKLITGVGLTDCFKYSNSNIWKYSGSFKQSSNRYIKSMKPAWNSLKGIDYDSNNDILLFDYNCMAVKTDYGKKQTQEIIDNISNSVRSLGMKGNEEACNAFSFNRYSNLGSNDLAESCKFVNSSAQAFLDDEKQFLDDEKQFQKRLVENNKLIKQQEKLKESQTLESFNSLRFKDKKIGDKVCSFNNEFGYVERIEGDKIKFLKIGAVSKDQGYFFTGNSSKFNFTRVDEFKWVDAGHLGLCYFEN